MTKDGLKNPPGMEGIKAWCCAPAEFDKNGIVASYFVDDEGLIPSVKFMKERGYFLEDISGVDVREGIMLVYHFDCYDQAARIAIRLLVPHECKQAPSIISIFSGANWHERECRDFFGVQFAGNPDMKPMLLPDDMEIHPLLKEQESQRKSMYQVLPLAMLTDHSD
jgi:NADH-quinone oxidoreductase subunit C